MPIYFYKCPDEHFNEIELKMADYTETIKCPEKGCKKKAKRSFQGQNVLGIVENGTRGGKYNMLKKYGGAQ